MLLQERPVDQLDMDAAVLHGLDGVGDLHQLPCRSLRLGKRAGLNVFGHSVSVPANRIDLCPFRRYAMKPTLAKPTIIIAQVEGSGTGTSVGVISPTMY